MPSIRCPLALFALGLLCLPGQAWAQDAPAPAAPAAAEPAAEDATALALRVLARADDMHRGDSSAGKLSMTVVTANWQRTLDLSFWNKGKEKSLVRILAPKKEKGTTTLRVGKEMWNYLPKVRRVMKVPSSMMGGSWMGSHFSNDDLVKQNRMSEDFKFEISFRGEREGKSVVEVTCIPNEDAVIVWGKIVVNADAKTLDPFRIEYFDEDLALARTMKFTEPKVFGQRTVPSVIRVVPAEAPSEYTEVRYHDVDFDATVADSMFTKRALKR